MNALCPEGGALGLVLLLLYLKCAGRTGSFRLPLSPGVVAAADGGTKPRL